MPGEKIPPGLLTTLANPKLPLGRIIQLIEHEAIPQVIDFGFFLFTINGETIQSLNQYIKRICTLSARDKRLHDVTIKVGDCGVTIHSNDAELSEAIEVLRRHCKARKYSTKSGKWYGLLLSSGVDFSIRTGLTLEAKFEQSMEMDALIDSLPTAPKIIGGKIHDYSDLPKKRKVGRNDPCTCGSKLKAKKCCYR